MRTIALITQKGGSGKSTLSASIAVVAAAHREFVFLIDMDPQKSLSGWMQHRNDENLAVQALKPPQLPSVLQTLAGGNVSLTIIDTPAGVSDVSEAAMQAADLIVIPVRPTAFDIWASEATCQRAKELHKEFVFILNQCPIVPGNRRIREGVDALEAMGGVLQPMITARVDYQEAMVRGLGPTEYSPTGNAAEEIRQLWTSLRRRIARAKLNQQGVRRAA